MVHREAGAGVGVATGRLGEGAAEVARGRREVVLEEVGLEVEHELVAAEHVGGHVGIDRRVLGHAQPAAGATTGTRLMLVGAARVEREEHGRARHRGAQEVAPAHADAARRSVDQFTGAAGGFTEQRRGRRRHVLAVRHRAELDGQLVVVVVHTTHHPMLAPERRGCVVTNV